MTRFMHAIRSPFQAITGTAVLLVGLAASSGAQQFGATLESAPGGAASPGSCSGVGLFNLAPDGTLTYELDLIGPPGGVARLHGGTPGGPDEVLHLLGGGPGQWSGSLVLSPTGQDLLLAGDLRVDIQAAVFGAAAPHGASTTLAGGSLAPASAGQLHNALILDYYANHTATFGTVPSSEEAQAVFQDLADLAVARGLDPVEVDAALALITPLLDCGQVLSYPPISMPVPGEGPGWTFPPLWDIVFPYVLAQAEAVTSPELIQALVDVQTTALEDDPEPAELQLLIQQAFAGRAWAPAEQPLVDAFLDVADHSQVLWFEPGFSSDSYALKHSSKVIIADAVGALYGSLLGPIGSILYGAGFSVLYNEGAFQENPPDMPWSSHGDGLVGVLSSPLCYATGSLQGGSAVSVELTNALPSTLAGLFLSASSEPVPFKGGTLAAFPFLMPPLIVPASPSGTISLPAVMPGGLEGLGLELFLQFAVVDPSAPQGLALSNVIQGQIP